MKYLRGFALLAGINFCVCPDSFKWPAPFTGDEFVELLPSINRDTIMSKSETGGGTSGLTDAGIDFSAVFGLPAHLSGHGKPIIGKTGWFGAKNVIDAETFSGELQKLLLRCEVRSRKIIDSEEASFDGCNIKSSDNLIRGLAEGSHYNVLYYLVNGPHEGITFYVVPADSNTRIIGNFTILDQHFHKDFLYLMDAVPRHFRLSESDDEKGPTIKWSRGYENFQMALFPCIIYVEKQMLYIGYKDAKYLMLDLVQELAFLIRLEYGKSKTSALMRLHARDPIYNPHFQLALSENEKKGNQVIWTFNRGAFGEGKIQETVRLFKSTARLDNEQNNIYFRCKACEKSFYHLTRSNLAMRILAAVGKPFFMGGGSELTTKPFSSKTEFKLPADYINIREIIKSLTISNLDQLDNLRSIARNAIAHAIVVIGDRALLIYGNLTSPHYLRVPFEIQTAKGLSAAVLFNPVINLNPTGKDYKEVRWNWSNHGIFLFPYTEGKFDVYNQGKRLTKDTKGRGEEVPPVNLSGQPSHVTISRHHPSSDVEYGGGFSVDHNNAPLPVTVRKQPLPVTPRKQLPPVSDWKLPSPLTTRKRPSHLTTQKQPSPLPDRVPLTNSTEKNLQSSSPEHESHAITAEAIAKYESKLKRAIIRETPGGVNVYNAFSSVTGGMGLDFDALTHNEKRVSIGDYSYGIETFGKYLISSNLFSRLLVQLKAWPRNFILEVIPNLNHAQGSVDHYFFFKNPDSDNENDIQYAGTFAQKTDLESTIDIGIENPKYVRIAHNVDHYDSVVNGKVVSRMPDGNCFFYSVLGSMTPEMRKQFFSNAQHKYDEGNYGDFEALSRGSLITDEQANVLAELKIQERRGMSLEDYINYMTLKDYKIYKGVKDDIKFMRKLMRNKFQENVRLYIEFFGLAVKPQNQ